jgi:hypothetical protein
VFVTLHSQQDEDDGGGNTGEIAAGGKKLARSVSATYGVRSRVTCRIMQNVLCMCMCAVCAWRSQRPAEASRRLYGTALCGHADRVGHGRHHTGIADIQRTHVVVSVWDNFVICRSFRAICQEARLVRAAVAAQSVSVRTTRALCVGDHQQTTQIRCRRSIVAVQYSQGEHAHFSRI